MNEAAQTTALATRDESLLAYLKRMAETTHIEPVRLLLGRYAELEKMRLGQVAFAGGNPVVARQWRKSDDIESRRFRDGGMPENKEERGENIMKSPSRLATQSQTKKNGAKLFTFNASPGVKQVCLAGDFNKWDPTALPMSKRAGMFVKRVELEPGDHHYKYVVDGQWMTDPAAEAQAANEFGSMNSVVRVQSLV